MQSSTKRITALKQGTIRTMAHEREATRFLQPEGDARTGDEDGKGEFFGHQPRPGGQQFSHLLKCTADAQVEVSSMHLAKGLLKGRRNLVSVGLLAASIYSTLLSGLFLVVATVQPRYGFTISSRGSFSPSSAALLTAFLGKTIELTFVMTFLAFLGQILSRRAVRQQGINLANLAMRSWIL
jgi:hypothetical protein